MKQLYLSIAMAFILFTACNNQSEPANGNSNDFTYETNDSTVMPPDSSSDPANLLPDSIGNIPTLSNDPGKIKLASDPLEGIDIKSKLNPAHGESGHRCDVPVGAHHSSMPKKIGMSLCKPNK
ncbi:MAG: hypothetical protein SH857_13850 [Chitinophagales bacterium]|nr:hypothetical protein [Chitinophagales bacterium]